MILVSICFVGGGIRWCSWFVLFRKFGFDFIVIFMVFRLLECWFVFVIELLLG